MALGYYCNNRGDRGGKGGYYTIMAAPAIRFNCSATPVPCLIGPIGFCRSGSDALAARAIRSAMVSSNTSGISLKHLLHVATWNSRACGVGEKQLKDIEDRFITTRLAGWPWGEWADYVH